MENYLSQSSAGLNLATLRRESGLIRFGDRIFVKIAVRGRVMFEVIWHHVADRTDLLSKIRSRCAGMRGLVTLYVRNMDRGWSREEPLMLYASAQSETARPAQRMFAPWETH